MNGLLTALIMLVILTISLGSAGCQNVDPDARAFYGNAVLKAAEFYLTSKTSNK